ncbi:hypothetical protein Tco_1212258 [Tanacetum coccineum]
MVPKAVLMRSGLVSLTTARPVNTAQLKTTVNSARPMTNIFNKAHSTVRRPINNKTTTKTNNFNQMVNTVKDINVNFARPKVAVNTAKPKAVLNAVKGNQVNVVKASACWVWKPKTKVIDHVSKYNKKGVIDSRCSRQMTGNMSYLTNFEEIDGGYVLPLEVTPKEEKTPAKKEYIKTGTKACDDAGKARMKTVPGKDYILLPLWPADLPFSQNSKSSPDAGFKPLGDNEKKVTEEPGKEDGDPSNKNDSVNSTNNINTASDGYSTNNVNTVSSTVNTVGIEVNVMDVKSAFLYGKIEKEVYVCQPSGFEDPDFPDNMISFLALQRLQVKQKEDGIFISQDKYVTEILKKFGFTDVKTASTPMETQKPLLKDEDDEEVDVHLYRLMIGSFMYLNSSRPDIIYLKGQPKLGLWYPKDSSFDLVAYTNSDYAGASLDRKSTTGGC